MQIAPLTSALPPSRARLEQELVGAEQALDWIQLEQATTRATHRQSEMQMQRDIDLLASAHHTIVAGEVFQVGVAAGLGAVGLQLGMSPLLAVPLVGAVAVLTACAAVGRHLELRSQRAEAEQQTRFHERELDQGRALEIETRACVERLRQAVAQCPPQPSPPNFLELAASI